MTETIGYLTDEIVDGGGILGGYNALIYDDVGLEGLGSVELGPADAAMVRPSNIFPLSTYGNLQPPPAVTHPKQEGDVCE